MPIVIGVDLGTTKITSLAVEAGSETILAMASTVNDANITSEADRARGRSEWQADRILAAACQCLRDISRKLEARSQDVVGLGVTGQQHGMVLVDANLHPISPLINWQDRRALDRMPDRDSTWLATARQAMRSDIWQQTGCQLHPGFMAVTLFELGVRGLIPAGARSLFIMDYWTAVLTGQDPVCEPSCAGSSGVFDVRCRNWHDDAIRALGLSRSLFPEIREANELVGGLTNESAQATGLPAGTPVYAAIGDHQASFLGSVADRRNSILVNVGTGAQVAVYTDGFDFVAPIELRPFPCGGNLLSNVGLAGGWSYQVLEQFFQDVGSNLFQAESSKKLYETMNQLAKGIAAGAEGLSCEPRFSGTRLDPAQRGSITGLSPQNFTAGHLARAILEGMSRSLHDGFKAIRQVTNHSPTKLVAAGNGLRENLLLAEIVSQAFDLSMSFTEHREEAAFGAALVASVGQKIFANLDEAAQKSIRTTRNTENTADRSL
jgi:sugar (pentulose or hexulose) kinase